VQAKADAATQPLDRKNLADATVKERPSRGLRMSPRSSNRMISALIDAEAKEAYGAGWTSAVAPNTVTAASRHEAVTSMSRFHDRAA
jgi:hypothetical protein